MISILIPTYNYDITTLVRALHKQVEAANVVFEIIVFDDASGKLIAENDVLNSLSNTTFKPLSQNIGRSAIRNLLADTAKYENLLFLDADTKVVREDFIQKYLDAITPSIQIIYGGIVYQKEPPAKDELLRWIYGNKREALPVSEREKQPYLRFLTLNFFIKKAVFKAHRFNEEIPNLRHEDTLFALGAKKLALEIKHIDNPVIHLGLESSKVFLRKSMESVEALKLFVNENLILSEETSLSKKGEQLKNPITTMLAKAFLTFFKGPIEKNLISSQPSLFWFDVYRLCYYLKL
ncbi:b-glycosyltransferase-related protein, glycosyltransferase family 2 protein [unidentified eubacterium SCB49]|nr:b-glycosyltransferase-related protein, glycosyltransferase family 2 protein [unidentified eubacterium SCB49]